MDRGSPKRRTRHVVFVKLARKKIARVCEQSFPHVGVHVLPNLRQQHCGTGEHKHTHYRQEEPAWSYTVRLTRRRLAHVKVVMKEHVETEIVRKVLRRDHQSERYGTGRITTAS